MRRSCLTIPTFRPFIAGLVKIKVQRNKSKLFIMIA